MNDTQWYLGQRDKTAGSLVAPKKVREGLGGLWDAAKDGFGMGAAARKATPPDKKLGIGHGLAGALGTAAGTAPGKALAAGGAATAGVGAVGAGSYAAGQKKEKNKPLLSRLLNK